MDDGKRAAAVAKFNELLPTRKDVGNTAFRANVMFFLQEEFGCTVSAAATHYNYAKHLCTQTSPELLLALTGGAAGDVPALGRPAEKNNGGRKKKVVTDTTTEAPADGVVTDTTTEAATEVVTETTTTEVPVEAVAELVNVLKKKDNTIVLSNVTRAEAEAAVAKAAAGKKAALIIA